MFDTRLTTEASDGATRGRALRAFGWHELAVRIKAARDFRQVLASDGGALVASFSDAAGGHLGLGERGKPDVNPDALGRLKACDGIDLRADGEAAESDREI